MKQLPESFCIAREGRTPKTCPRWNRFIDYLIEANAHREVIKGNQLDYYGLTNRKLYGSDSVNSLNELLTLDQFEEAMGWKEPEQWQPKPGEMVQVSQDDIKWYDREFFAIAYNNSKGKQYGCYTDGYSDLCCWKFCRPIPKITTYSRSEAIKLLSQHTGKPESEIEIE